MVGALYNAGGGMAPQSGFSGRPNGGGGGFPGSAGSGGGGRSAGFNDGGNARFVTAIGERTGRHGKERGRGKGTVCMTTDVGRGMERF